MDTAKFCTQCGKPLPPDVRHCPYCGTEVTVGQPTPPAETGQTASSPPPFPSQPVPATGAYGVSSAGTEAQPPSVSGRYAGSPTTLGRPRPAAQPTESSPRARPRKRLGGGGITLLAGLIMLAMHVLVLEGGVTVQNIGVDAAIIACGLVMLFARGGLSVALGLFASLCVSILDVMLRLAVFKSATASGSQGFQTLLSSMEWVSVIGMILVLLGFLAALGSLFRRS